MRDFTSEKYRELLQVLVDNKIDVYTVKDWIKRGPSKGTFIRHDVDRNPKNALEISRIEYEMGLKTTYYFRITSNSFNSDYIKQISERGHEIGYHYEDLSVSSGDFEKAERNFSQNLKTFRKICQVETIVAHGRPLSPIRNRDLIERINLAEYDLIGDASLSIDYHKTFYFSDTGRTWGSTSANVRDTEKSLSFSNISSTDSLKTFLSNNRSKKIAIVMHPERWPKNYVGYIKSVAFDLGANFVKRNITLFGNFLGWQR